ncbi:B12-binding domain-containing radical SAM protein [Streptomyces anthocyanicus]|uniref:B12-binding domain-containing radical SAM protein n=1 Tax=Streptomyces anthocyanicus TaxID=68174 RepID=UPI0038216810
MTAPEVLLGMPQVRTPEEAGHLPVLNLSVWVCDLTYTQQAMSAETIPQATAGLLTYASTRMQFAQPPRIFKYPEDLAEALETHGAPDVIGFAHYIWNAHLATGFARLIKQHFPRTIVVMGGPHYPVLREEQQRFWAERFDGAVDYYVDGEGEVAFADLLAALNSHAYVGELHRLNQQAAGDLRPVVPGVHWMGPDGTLYALPPRKRIPDLSVVPSPYVAGLLDEYLDGRTVPTVQTNRGCVFTCNFCQEGTNYFTKIAKKSREQISEELHYIGRKLAPLIAAGQARNELLITDSNFGMYPEDFDTCTVIRECQEAYGWPRVVNVTTGKNQRERVLKAIAQVPGTISLSGSVQSLDPGVLEAVKRKNIDPSKLIDIALASAEAGAGSYSEVILALPGDSKEKHLKSLAGLMEARFDRLNMFQLTLLPGSEMCTDKFREDWGLTTRWRVIPRCYGSYKVLGEEVRAAELDEVCVTLPDMPYEDYIECRVMNLLLASLYNQGTFGAMVALLRAHKVGPMRWLELARSLDHGPALARVLSEFQGETDGQLWESRDKLMRFATDNVDRYVGGELGNNLLYTYRMRLISEAMDDLADVAMRACVAALREVGVAVGRGSLAENLVREAAWFHKLRLSEVFVADPPAELAQEARFDVEAFIEADRRGEDVADLRRFRFPERRVRRFVLSDDQRATLRHYMAQFGDTAAGIGWLLTKVRIADIVRAVRTPAGSGEGSEPRSEAIAL